MVRTSNRLKPIIINEVNRYKHILRNAHVPVVRLIVFGSQAKGTAHKWSDIDVAVVSPRFGKDYFDELGYLMQLRDDNTIDIEPHPFHPDDLNDRWSTMVQEIKTYGIEV